MLTDIEKLLCGIEEIFMENIIYICKRALRRKKKAIITILIYYNAIGRILYRYIV